MKCVHCKAKLRSESNFCLKCGKPVNAMECYISEIEESGASLSRKTDKESLEHIKELTVKIFERTRQNPDLKYEVRTFFESYLPMISDVLGKYSDLKMHDGDKTQPDGAKEVKDDLTDVLNTTEHAFELMYRELCENDIMELKVNIEALKAQIARDGLLKSEFEISE